ncbi:helix-turn-helix domain-containing protein [Pseudonocardia sp. TRM90224]|uniref:helix-turn-helix domain-containing protein n=1 Tax=Pseudonocardia sp. TRM90224 TaxID=2812678 RepID=UPI001E378726|nr:GAF domain-containing protein [Pseudonocardia sp. TRM90224]
MTSALELLRLLAQDASADVLDGQAKQSGTHDPADEEARRLALRVRAGIDARRRREAELAALVDTARDLASADEPGGVLDAIVRRARSLLGTDVSYLTLFDEDHGDTYMRATAGSVSARFQQLRLPTGAGLGGLVAQTRRPYWTADYPADERYAHTSEIDGAVGEEGLVAICGTPLLVDGEFVGVLFAANRSRRPFDRDEIALLGSLAALAAVSIRQSRRAAETAAALAELSAAHAAIEQAAHAHDRFTRVVLAGGGVDDIVAALGELLGCWVAAVDDDGQRIAVHGEPPDDDLAGLGAVRRSAATGRLAEDGGLSAAVVQAAGQRLGALVLGRGAFDGGQVRTVERAAMTTALVLLFRLRAAESDRRVRTDLLADLLVRPADALDRGLVERGRLLGLRLQHPHVLVVASHSATEPGRSMVLAVADAGGGRGLVMTRGEETVAVVPGTDPSAVAAVIGAAARPGVTVGAAGPVVPGAGLRDALAEARRTAVALAALGRPAGSARDLGFAGLVGGSAAEVAAFVEDVLGPVLAHDVERGTELVATLRAWFAAGGSPRRASGELHVHVNTVAQRLDRVTALLGEGWQQPDRALQVQLALHLQLLRG